MVIKQKNVIELLVRFMYKRVILQKQMSVQHLQNNWIEKTTSSHNQPSQQCFMLKVLSQYKSGVQLFNRIATRQKPFQQKNSKVTVPQQSCCSFLPNLPKINFNQSMQQLDTNEKNLQNLRRSSIIKDGPTRTISQAKRKQPNWYHKRYGALEMKGVVFRKRNNC